MCQTQYFFYFCKREDYICNIRDIIASLWHSRYRAAYTSDHSIFVVGSNSIYALLTAAIQLVTWQ